MVSAGRTDNPVFLSDPDSKVGHVQLRYFYRVYPTPRQRIALVRAMGCARWVYNEGLRMREQAWIQDAPYLTDAALSKALTGWKTEPDRVWLGEVSAVVLQQALADLGKAYRNWFASLKGERAGARVGHPRFRSRHDNRQAIRYTRNARFNVLPNGKLRLPKVGDLRVKWSRVLPSDPSSVTVIKDAAGRYYCSFVVEAGDDLQPASDAMVGVDVGLTHFAVLSDGTKIANPRFLRTCEKRLTARQRDLARKRKGSKNRGKARVRVARAYARVRAARTDFHHKLSTRLVGENQAIVVEKLNVKGLARTRLAKSVHDAGWGMFLNMLEYKSKRAGRTFVRVDPAYTSQTCSTCGVLDGPKPLSVREWTCRACSTIHDRDVNAAMNILTAAGPAVTACGAQVRRAHVPAPRREADIHPDAACSTRSVEGISAPLGRREGQGMSLNIRCR